MTISPSELIQSLKTSINTLESAVLAAKQAFVKNNKFSSTYLARFNAWFSIIDTQKQHLQKVEATLTETDGAGEILRDITIINSLSDMIKKDAADFLVEISTSTKTFYTEEDLN
jgi:hypothetical protein